MSFTPVELIVPSAPGPVPKNGAPGFNEADYEGRKSTTATHDRCTWIPDPLGSGAMVLRFEVRDGDRADLFDEGTSYSRNEMWYQPQSQTAQVGDELWVAWSWLFGDGVRGDLFRTPSGWALAGFQLHPPVLSSMLSPSVCLDVDGGKMTWRGHSVIRPDYALGRRQYALAHIKVGETATTGGSELWHVLDTPPDVEAAPQLPWKGYRTGASDGGTASNPGLKGRNWYKSGLYRLDQPSDAGSYPWVFYEYGWAVQPTKQQAVEKGWHAAAAPPPPDLVLEALNREWAVFLEDRAGPRGQWTQDQRWRADNPGEYQKLLDYRAGGSKPVLTTEPGRRMVEHVTAWHEAQK